MSQPNNQESIKDSLEWVEVFASKLCFLRVLKTLSAISEETYTHATNKMIYSETASSY